MLNFGNFRGSFGHFYALIDLSMHLCAKFKFELHANAPVHIKWLGMECVSLVATLDRMQEVGMNVKHLCNCRLAANIEIHGFKILVNEKLV